MLHLFLGADDFTKKEQIALVVKDKAADLIVYQENDKLPDLSKLLESDLFSKVKVFIFDGFLPEISKNFVELHKTPNIIFICLDSLDKRKKENKDMLKDKNLVVKEFNLPHGAAFDRWIEAHVNRLGGQIVPEAVEMLAVFLGRDNAKETKVGGKVVFTEEVFSLWQADSEINKLLAYAPEKPISVQDVEDLVQKNGESDIFDLTNAIADGQKKEAVIFLHSVLKNETGTEEKGAAIKLNALLAEQFRSIAITQELLANKTPEEKILELTGWKPGRLYVIKRSALKFTPSKVLETLNKLRALDVELKSSTISPKVMLDLIVAGLF